MRQQAHMSGQAIIFFALALPVLVGIAGLALDAGHLYWERRTLQTIADAAALVGAQNANFNRSAPAINNPGGINDARASAIANGVDEAAGDVITVTIAPAWTAPAGYDYTYPNAHIEVVIQRPVNNWFMGVFGQGTATIQARAIARCYLPGYGNASILAMNRTSATAITFNGGGSTAVRVDGDIHSYGGIDATGGASHFLINGSAFSYSYPAETDMTFSAGNQAYGVDNIGSIVAVENPVVQDSAEGYFAWPHPEGPNQPYPTNFVWPDFYSPPIYGKVALQCTSDPNRGCGEGGPNGATSGEDTCTGGIRVDTGNMYTNVTSITFLPGLYTCNVTIQTGTVKFQSGLYIFQGQLNMQGGNISDTTGGVLFKFTGTGIVFDTNGSATLNFSKVTAVNATPWNGNHHNTWNNIIIYATQGNVNMTGTSTRTFNGSIYAPLGNVSISGNGTSAGVGAVVNGQVIADTVTFSGNGPAVSYNAFGLAGNFGPFLVNTP